MSGRGEVASACEALGETSDEHQLQIGKDALYVFLRVHHCICVRLERDADFSTLKNLNEIFAERFVKVYDCIRLGHVLTPDFSYKWVVAISAYRNSPHSYTVLARMAFAHILDDLPDCIVASAFRDKEKYDAIFEVIIGCLENVVKATAGASSWELVRYRLLHNRVTYYPLAKLRDVAWRKAENRRLLAQELRKPSRDAD